MKVNLGKILGIDFGKKRIGLALSDEEKIMAFPFVTLSPEELAAQIKEIIETEKVEKIIVGLPRNMDGTLGQQVAEVRSQVELLGDYQSLVEYQDESATSFEAEKQLRAQKIDPAKRKELIDSMAAKIILEDYLNERV